MKNKIYKLLSVVVTILICISILTSIPTAAILKTKIFEYPNYIIDYSIINEWDNHQNIEIQITNTGNETIYNWALGYDAGGDISNVWNGNIYNSNETNYIIKNAGYNCVIKP